MIDDEERWREQAKCHGIPPEFFFSTLQEGQEEAARFCNGSRDHKPCPVKVDCLLWSIDHHFYQGVYGGETEKSREKVRRDKPLMGFLRQQLEQRKASV